MEMNLRESSRGKVSVPNVQGVPFEGRIGNGRHKKRPKPVEGIPSTDSGATTGRGSLTCFTCKKLESEAHCSSMLERSSKNGELSVGGHSRGGPELCEEREDCGIFRFPISTNPAESALPWTTGGHPPERHRHRIRPAMWSLDDDDSQCLGRHRFI
ncbi:hypothetical protein KSP39_PZI010987 [Platanthera zijinensis]|uniref:Uncharacterized protein n=1 Tax=Platanthera zijinensis TaxID=2320716 RepID=A0AAP0BFS8_9ASPA